MNCLKNLGKIKNNSRSIIIHSSGVNNPYLSYVAGSNKYHFWIGKNIKNEVVFFPTELNIDKNIDIHICILEDDLTSKIYCAKCLSALSDLCILLCKKYGLTEENIYEYNELSKYNPGPRYWWKKFNFSIKIIKDLVNYQLQK